MSHHFAAVLLYAVQKGEMELSDWFTVEKIDETTFAVSEYHHWERTHCYLLLGDQCAILIDSGLGVANIRAVVDSLTDLPVTVITTHVHWDHIGGHKHFECLAVHEAEKEWLAGAFPLPLQAVISNLTAEPCEFPEDFQLEDYRVFQGEPQRILHDGDIIDLGGRVLQVIHTPGHSPGHCCFYDPDRGYLFSGDLIYSGCLDAFYPTTDPVMYMHSLKRVSKLNIQSILPGHYRLDIPVSMADAVCSAFLELERKNMLRHGGGVFSFDGFKIHL